MLRYFVGYNLILFHNATLIDTQAQAYSTKNGRRSYTLFGRAIAVLDSQIANESPTLPQRYRFRPQAKTQPVIPAQAGIQVVTLSEGSEKGC